MTPTITFKFRTQSFKDSGIEWNIILTKIKISIDQTLCDFSKIHNDKQIVQNELIRLKWDLNWNLWSGINKAEIGRQIENEKSTIYYKISLTRLFFTLGILIGTIWLFGIFSFFENGGFNNSITGILTLGILTLGMLNFLIILFRHWWYFQEIKNIIKTCYNKG